MNTDYGMVLTTFANETEAQALAAALLTEHLAACVQMLPIQSAYRWQGAIQREPEILALIKTRAALYPAIEAMIRARHSYDTPEIIFVPIVAGSTGYLQWLDESTSGQPPKKHGLSAVVEGIAAASRRRRGHHPACRPCRLRWIRVPPASRRRIISFISGGMGSPFLRPFSA